MYGKDAGALSTKGWVARNLATRFALSCIDGSQLGVRDNCHFALRDILRAPAAAASRALRIAQERVPCRRPHCMPNRIQVLAVMQGSDSPIALPAVLLVFLSGAGTRVVRIGSGPTVACFNDRGAALGRVQPIVRYSRKPRSPAPGAALAATGSEAAT
jgi:hypothetical protein